MTSTKMSEERLLALGPCPFCGASFKMAQEPRDNHPVAGQWYIYHDYGPLGSAARKCPIEVPKHFETADEAISAWNRRHTIPYAAVVKKLEWADRIVDDEGGGSDIVGSVVQTGYPKQYWTSLHHEDDGQWRLYFGLSIIGRFATETEAKAAAQAAFEARILSALVPHTTENGGEVEPVAYADPRAIAALFGTPARQVYLSALGSHAYSMPLYATPQPSPHVPEVTDEMVERADVLRGLEEMGRHGNYELGYHQKVYGDDDDEPTHGKWVIWREHGGINDREWTVMATGSTPAEALAALNIHDAGDRG